MSGIWKINMVQNQATQQDFNKTTFRKGDSFSARILNINKESGELVIRLLDGRQFPAKIDGSIDDALLENYLLKFVVDDFSGGKLTLTLSDSKALDNLVPLEEKTILEEVIKNLGLKIPKGDEYILKEMIKFNIPLTQENFDEIKNIIDFINKINIKEGEEDKFIDKYLAARNIEPNSEKAALVKNTLKSFFSSLKTLDLNSLLMMKEENIPITEENIKSFNNINKEELVICKNIEELLDVLNAENKDTSIENKNINKGNENTNKENKISDYKLLNSLDKENTEMKSDISSNNLKDISMQENDIWIKDVNSNLAADKADNKTVIDNANIIVKDEEKNISDIKERETIVSEEEKIVKEKVVDGKENNVTKDIKESNIGEKDIELKSKITASKEEQVTEDKIIKDNSISKDIKDNKIFEKDMDLKFKIPTSDLVKNEIKEKISIMKNGIMQIIKANEDNPAAFNKAMHFIESKLQDFKIFNTLSNDYYYLNIPMNIKERDYDCKLVIKDERGKGKKIDSRNIKIATSIKTLNMEVVDAFINVNNEYISIDIHSQKAFMDMLESYRYKLIEDLSCNSYVFNVNIKEKIENFTLSNCRDFFDDNDLSIINVRV